ncbi:CDP-diacylglycerol--inositol 3-phosphatidyltransferase [Cephus cinctus]|uniref:CDP-diacylglycerol--inositol 3-phosphatidyltransferase n=1 Tax=Cephus cinctus TaxID=211228 RepID=A0AAJ7BS14_CEPCN|nr:CDP-diacylglycerol--inositol 3-phosphatidyltransferase [Cephus cinctus]XP_015592938.1 CDP-diacylglycerol--inositol 3-phosphatidyltransferase [Cephus cinctus]XP_015592940.1 CDP-diacylglycerol--inositol 3-phosphatidyltransferase [Cephus cinctus]
MTETENIFLFVPNIIGYGRIILALISFYFMPTNYVISSWCYIISGLLDALDGHAARYFNQSTRFGAILDQLTDRVGTMCLLVTLSQFYPRYTFWFQLSMAIDIACHWIYLHTTLLQGKTSHKFLDMSENPIMRLYYTNRQVLFVMCAGNEAFYAALYLLHFTEGPILVGISLIRAVAYISAPIAFVKTLISVLHGYVSCINLSIIDIKEREAQRKRN